MTMIDKPVTATDTEPETPPILPSIGQVNGVKIHTLRQSKGLTYNDLAEAVGLSDEDVMGIESGVLQPPNEAIIAIAHKLGVPTEAIAKSPETAVAETENVPFDAAEEETVPEPEPELPNPKSWSKLADTEQKLRAHAARKAADILREYGGHGVFSSGGTKSVAPRDVITLAQWIVYGQ